MLALADLAALLGDRLVRPPIRRGVAGGLGGLAEEKDVDAAVRLTGADRNRGAHSGVPRCLPGDRARLERSDDLVGHDLIEVEPLPFICGGSHTSIIIRTVPNVHGLYCSWYPDGMSEKEVTFSMRLPVELHEAAKKRATAEDRPIAWIVRTALREYLAKDKRK